MNSGYSHQYFSPLLMIALGSVLLLVLRFCSVLLLLAREAFPALHAVEISEAQAGQEMEQ